MWLVKSPLVSIQARYLPDESLSVENLYVSALAIGGPFMRNSTLIVGSLTDGVTSDGRAILEPPVNDSLGSSRAAASKFDVGGLLHATQSVEGRFSPSYPWA